DRDGAPLGAGAVGGERGEERGARLAERARALAAASNRGDERCELIAVRGLEALHEVAVAGTVVPGRAGLDRADRAAPVDADGDAVGRAEDLEADVVAERVVAGSREDAERAAAEPEHRDGGVDVPVGGEPRRLAHGAVGVDLDDLLARDE